MKLYYTNHKNMSTKIYLQQQNVNEYSKLRYEHFTQAQIVPEILRSDLSELCLHVKAIENSLSECTSTFNDEDDNDSYMIVPSIEEVIMSTPTPPERHAIKRSIEHLKMLGAIDKEGEGLTMLGKLLVRLPLSPGMGRMVLLSVLFKCLDPILTVVSCMSGKPPFVPEYDSRYSVEEVKLKYSHGERCDWFYLVNLWREFGLMKEKVKNAREMGIERLEEDELEEVEELELPVALSEEIDLQHQQQQQQSMEQSIDSNDDDLNDGDMDNGHKEEMEFVDLSRVEKDDSFLYRDPDVQIWLHKNKILSSPMRTIEKTKKQILSILISVGLVTLSSPSSPEETKDEKKEPKYNPLGGDKYNTHSANFPLIRSLIAAGIQPNLAQKTGRGRFRTADMRDLNIHVRSLNHQCHEGLFLKLEAQTFTVDEGSSSAQLFPHVNNPFRNESGIGSIFAFFEKWQSGYSSNSEKSNRAAAQLRDTTRLQPLEAFVFGEATYERIEIQHIDSQGDTSIEPMTVAKVDSWLEFRNIEPLRDVDMLCIADWKSWLEKWVEYYFENWRRWMIVQKRMRQQQRLSNSNNNSSVNGNGHGHGHGNKHFLPLPLKQADQEIVKNFKVGAIVVDSVAKVLKSGYGPTDTQLGKEIMLVCYLYLWPC